MMQERKNRVQQQYQGQEPQQQPEQVQQQYQPQEVDQSGDWEAQLNQYIDQRMAEKQQQVESQQRAQQEQLESMQHQEKFMQGASRYPDFNNVVGNPNLNISQEMFNASRMMPDSSAFFYAAAKTNPSELNRIGMLKSPMAMAAEMARLDERMRQPTQRQSSTPSPMSNDKGDMTHKKGVTHSRAVDSLIKSHADMLMKRGRKVNR